MITRQEQKSLESRRKEVVEIYRAGGWTQRELAEEYGVHKRTIEKWVHNAREDEEHGLELIEHAVPACHLSEKELKRLEKLLLEGSFSLGFDDGLWTCPRVSLLVKKKFNVS